MDPIGREHAHRNVQTRVEQGDRWFRQQRPGKAEKRSNTESPWDVLHPGRKFADKLADSGIKQSALIERVEAYLAGRKLKKLPRKLAAQLKDDAEEALSAAKQASAGVSEIIRFRMSASLYGEIASEPRFRAALSLYAGSEVIRRYEENSALFKYADQQIRIRGCDGRWAVGSLGSADRVHGKPCPL